MVGYGCYRAAQSACGPSSTSWSLRAHVWCGCEEVVPQWMMFQDQLELHRPGVRFAKLELLGR